MYDKRTWLAERGLAKAGTRGRFSRDAIEALKAAEADGVKFHDSTRQAAPVPVVGEDGKVKTETRDVDPYAPHALAIREGTLTFKSPKGGHKHTVQVSAKEACETCRYSFGWCYCDTPTYRNWRTSEVMNLA